MRIDMLEHSVQVLESKISALQEGAIVVPIQTFAPEPFEILKEIKVVVQPSGDEFIASFFDANINASGCNEVEAVANLKEVLINRFEHLDPLPSKKLGPAPAKQIAVLRVFMRRKP